MEIREQLFEQCVNYVEQRIAAAQLEIDYAQASANAEEKSSAGDKYETGRAMAHLERDKAAQQLQEAIKLKASLAQVNSSASKEVIELGSVVTTTQGNFYLAISAGKLQVNDLQIFALSTASPLGQKLLSKKVGDEFIFNKKPFGILEIQ
jgi:transcription elongation GreA/GreB family factor